MGGGDPSICQKSEFEHYVLFLETGETSSAGDPSNLDPLDRNVLTAFIQWLSGARQHYRDK